jgi:serine/threonine protein kinase
MQAVTELAERDIVHRDLKPENIIIKGVDNTRRSPDGRNVWAPNLEISPSQVFLTDFGFSLDLKKKTQLPIGGVLALSPEQAKLQAFSDNALNTKADVYCCGIIFYEM